MGNRTSKSNESKVDPHSGLTPEEKKELEKAYSYGLETTKKQPRRILGRRNNDTGLNKEGFRQALERLAQSKQQHLFKEIKKLEHQRKDFVDVISETLFDSFDVQNNNEISLQELKQGIAVCLRGTDEDKMKWGFERLLHRRRGGGGRGGDGGRVGGGVGGGGGNSSGGQRRGGRQNSDKERRSKAQDRNEGEGNSSEDEDEDTDSQHRRRRGGRRRRRRRRKQHGSDSDSDSDDDEQEGEEEEEKEAESNNTTTKTEHHQHRRNPRGPHPQQQQSSSNGTDLARHGEHNRTVHLLTETVGREDLRHEIQRSVATQRKHQRFIETRALVSAQQLCETLNRQLSDARLSELRIATSLHVEAILLKAEETLDEQVEHCMKLMDVDKDGVISYMDYKLSLSRNPMLLEMINPFSIHSILEDATSGNPTRVSRVSLECSKACSHHTVSSHQPRHRGSLIEEGDWATMMASKKTHVDPVTGNGRGVHAMKQSVSAKRIRPGKKRQANIFLEKNR